MISSYLSNFQVIDKEMFYDKCLLNWFLKVILCWMIYRHLWKQRKCFHDFNCFLLARMLNDTYCIHVVNSMLMVGLTSLCLWAIMKSIFLCFKEGGLQQKLFPIHCSVFEQRGLILHVAIEHCLTKAMQMLKYHVMKWLFADKCF